MTSTPRTFPRTVDEQVRRGLTPKGRPEPHAFRLIPLVEEGALAAHCSCGEWAWVSKPNKDSYWADLWNVKSAKRSLRRKHREHARLARLNRPKGHRSAGPLDLGTYAFLTFIVLVFLLAAFILYGWVAAGLMVGVVGVAAFLGAAFGITRARSHGR